MSNYRPTIEQLESMPVVQCTNSSPDPELLPPPFPENEDELHVNGGSNGDGGSGGGAEVEITGESDAHQVMTGGGDEGNTTSSDDEGQHENYSGEGMALQDFIEHVRLKGRKGRGFKKV